MYKLKRWVVVSIYIIAIGVSVSTIFLAGKFLKNIPFSNDENVYVYKEIFEENMPVVGTIKNDRVKPFDDETVSIIKYYYDKDSSSDRQEKSLIEYQNTYLPNTGILYGSKNKFNIYSIMEGTIENIVPDETMGNIVTIRHNNKLESIYQSVDQLEVSIGDQVKVGDLIGCSGINKIDSTYENMLLFEINYDGIKINPETFYEKDLSEFE